MPASGKRRAKSRAKAAAAQDDGGFDEEAPRKLEQLDQDEILNDEVDEFHSHRDKVMLDEPEPESDDDDDDMAHESIMELPDAEESSSDDDDESSEEDEPDGDDNKFAAAELNSVDGEESEDSGAEEARLSNAWGKKRDQYYDTDYVDGDYRLEDEELEMAEEEEKEAKLLQSRRLADRDDADYGLDELDELDEAQVRKLKAKDNRSQQEVMTAFNEELEEIQLDGRYSAAQKESIAKDLSGMTDEDRVALIAERAPELLDLCEELNEKSVELEGVIKPALLLHAEGARRLAASGLEYLQLRHRLILLFFVNVGYYMYLRAAQNPTSKIAVHPCIRQLVRLRNVFAELEPIHTSVREDLQSFVDKQVDSDDASDDDTEAAEATAQTDEDEGSEEDEDDDDDNDDDDDGGAYMAELMGAEKAVPKKEKKAARRIYSEMSLAEARRQAKSFSKLAKKGARKRTRAAADFGESIRGDDEMGMEKAMRIKEKSESRHMNAPRKSSATAAPEPEPVEEDEPNPEMEARAAKLLAAVEKAGSKKKAAKRLRQDAYNAERLAAAGVGPEDDGRNASTDENRALTWAMLKNKGLTPSRKKEVRNPRVRNKNKYTKAQKRRKGTVVDVRKPEMGRYSGEKFGIRSDITKGVKLS